MLGLLPALFRDGINQLLDKSLCACRENPAAAGTEFPRYGFARTSHRTDVLRPKQP